MEQSLGAGHGKAATIRSYVVKLTIPHEHARWLIPQAWVEKNATLLKGLQFQYLDGKVLEEESDEKTASVMVQVRLYLVIGEVGEVA